MTIYKSYYYPLIVYIFPILCLYLSFLLLVSCNKAASIAIDKVTPELSKATDNYDVLYSFHEGLARVKKNEKYGYIDKLGKEIISCRFDDARDFKHGKAIVEIKGKSGCINLKGKMIVPTKYDDIYSFEEDDVTVARIDEKYGAINQDGTVIIPFEYDIQDNFKEGLAPIRKDGLYGFINTKGEIVIPYQFEGIVGDQGFSEGLIGVRIKDEYGYIDKQGNVVIPFQKGLTGAPFSDGLAPIIRYNAFEYDTEFPMNFDSREMSYIDKTGRVVSDFKKIDCGYFLNGYSKVVNLSNHYVGMIDRKGRVVIPFGEYIDIGYACDGYALVLRNTKEYGFFNLSSGREVIPCIYEDADVFHGLGTPYFNEGLVPLKKNGKWGFLNMSNETIIPFNYDGVDPFSEGFAVVMRYGKYGYIDRYGNDTFH